MKRSSLAIGWILTAFCIVLAIAAITTAGCSTLGLNIVNPRYSLRDIRPRVQLAVPPSIDFDMTLGVDNPNPVALRLDRLDFDLFVNNSHLMHSITTQGVHIPARGLGDVPLTAHVGYDEIRSIFREIVNVVQGGRADYQIRGTADYNTPVGTLQFPVSVTSQIR